MTLLQKKILEIKLYFYIFLSLYFLISLQKCRIFLGMLRYMENQISKNVLISYKTGYSI